MSARRGILIILSSPSGAGKSTLAKALRKWDPQIVFSVSATTRTPRMGEVDGEDYHFIGRAEFLELVENDEMLEHAEVFGRLYGSPLQPVEEALRAGQDVIFDIDWQGGQQVRNSTLGQDVVSIFLLPPSIPELETRLRKRGQDEEDVISRRMQQSRSEISHWAEYDYVLVNEDLAKTEKQLRTILTTERMRRLRQTGLTDVVRQLNHEFEERG